MKRAESVVEELDRNNDMKPMETLGGYLRAVQLMAERVPSFTEYPFSLPALRNLSILELHPRVTFLIGENGTGKSTLLEAIAVAYGFNAEGGSRNFAFSSRASHSSLFESIRLIRNNRRPWDGFFFRAESFYNLSTNIEELDKEPGGPRRIIDSFGGRSLHEQSHGEAFFATFQNRFGGRGLYILDEPEAALSPTSQMAMLTLIHDLVRRDSQFIIATHSPIIMAYPDATILQLTQLGFEQLTYEETEHVAVTKQFINNREKMLRILLEGDVH